ncbi:hypothetical protein [Micromonospora haikouensis]|uniref:Uncharacterized protein n=1 Tax=Micromonospora haikouensis TaxID=686309 RepID=A0A0D0VXM5_9ACTN|nr:hypothetical protein [Micromonospora haikouensis]KIR65468.1 hypothetical protein TK50_08660 [Micromonospora haikouensis]
MVTTAWRPRVSICAFIDDYPVLLSGITPGNDQVLATLGVAPHEWARSFAGRPGVYVARGTVELLEVVDAILDRVPAAPSWRAFLSSPASDPRWSDSSP